jgi:predicted CoA-substrate-specific enzyme activase
MLGMDIGSVAVSYVLLDEAGSIAKLDYQFHSGNPATCLRDMLGNAAITGQVNVAVTASSPSFVAHAARYNDTICWVGAAKQNHPQLGSLLIIGGERFGLVSFDTDGGYRRMKTNTSCAAGTGSFLDQQARRLNLSGSAQLSDLARRNTGAVPIIASRCSVFAKTDIIHAQQEGYNLEEICDGICLGLARNAADVLFDDGHVDAPVVFIGGVARNLAVQRHLEAYLGAEFHTDEYAHVYGALGAALLLAASNDRPAPVAPLQVLEPVDEGKELFFPELGPSGSGFPDFNDHRVYSYSLKADWREKSALENPVEVDAYVDAAAVPDGVVIGIDVGSTSTKAAVCSEAGKVLGGFYTRTAGRPVMAVQALFEAIDHWFSSRDGETRVLGVATTGSGRKLAGKIVGADLVLDEISAHARAAVELHPDVDTIIEIGGQDSKFTALKNRRVVFSRMNTVCAAGTGSFIEEQAARLDVRISDFADLALGSKAPLTSDRCTVFMERDINCFLGRDYSEAEILAATAHSVCENYLLKVASEAHIGSLIAFQGATAKNRALVAAFEQKLGRSIIVSRYCHLTGAVGAALSLVDDGLGLSSFRGLEIYEKRIQVERENCSLCGNRCRLTIAHMGGTKVAYGFLCGRDYDHQGFVSKNTSGSSLAALVARSNQNAYPKDLPITEETTIGIPAALHLADDTEFWRLFFACLGYRAATSEGHIGAIRTGKLIAGAEFCAPMAAFHGHSRHVAERSDVLFVPSYIENIHDTYHDEAAMRKLCYYTQFAPSLVTSLEEGDGVSVVAPVLDPRRGKTRMLRTLHGSLEAVLGSNVTFDRVVSAFDAAESAKTRARSALRRTFIRRERRDFDVVLLGRPYTVGSSEMNKGIPEVFGALGIRAYNQDMLPDGPAPGRDVGELVDAFHWSYAARILEAAAYCGATSGIYPVLLTSFKCAPDSFMMDYFSRIMDHYDKPYLVLQLDEHESTIGYETRIEAAVRSFRNHFRESVPPRDQPPFAESPHVMPALSRSLDGKTVLLPNWDSIASPLVAANLRWAGYDVRLLEENERLIRESMKYNTGQCIPVHIILHEFAAYVANHDLDPSQTVLWAPESAWACNIALYPHYLKSMLERMGGGLDKAEVYLGRVLHEEISPPVAMRTYFAYLFAGLIRRISCRIRPFELIAGETDRIAAWSIQLFTQAFSGVSDLSDTLGEVVQLFETVSIDRKNQPRPKVALFGDLYVRDNDILNQGLVRFLESSGAEVITTPYSEYIRVISSAYFKKWIASHEFGRLLKFRSMLALVDLIEFRYRKLFPDFIREDSAVRSRNIENRLAQFNVTVAHEGESYENLLKIMHLLEKHPDMSLFVQANPAFCCPSLVTEAMGGEIERVTGVPVVSVTYDGTESWQNDVVVPYIHFAKERMIKEGAQ